MSSEPSAHPARPAALGRHFLDHGPGGLGGEAPGGPSSATWRGWMVGLLSVTVLCLAIPWLDFAFRPTMFSNSMFPASSLFILLLLLALLMAGLHLFRSRLGLTRAHLILVFCMTFVVNALPGCGFWTFWITMVGGGPQFATATNAWNETVFPHLPYWWLLGTGTEDAPLAPRSEWYQSLEAHLHSWFGTPDQVQPLDAFYGGLDERQAIPWAVWVLPYLAWAAMLLLLFGLMFALCGLLRRQWSENERLAFPLSQIPEEMTAGAPDAGGPAFLRSRAMWWGVGLILCFHSYNYLGDFFRRIPQIQQETSLNGYLTEPPWRGLVPVFTNVWLSVVALVFLLSREVSFSLWFFYLLLKVGILIAVQCGLGRNGWDFQSSTGPGSAFVSQGTGALLALAVAAFWMARQELRDSLRQRQARAGLDQPRETPGGETRRERGKPLACRAARRSLLPPSLGLRLPRLRGHDRSRRQLGRKRDAHRRSHRCCRRRDRLQPFGAETHDLARAAGLSGIEDQEDGVGEEQGAPGYGGRPSQDATLIYRRRAAEQGK